MLFPPSLSGEKNTAKEMLSDFSSVLELILKMIFSIIGDCFDDEDDNLRYNLTSVSDSSQLYEVMETCLIDGAAVVVAATEEEFRCDED